MKVKDHIHINGKFRGHSHQECKLNLSLSKKMHVLFHNLPNYDSHLMFQEVRICYLKIIIITNLLSNLQKIDTIQDEF